MKVSFCSKIISLLIAGIFSISNIGLAAPTLRTTIMSGPQGNGDRTKIVLARGILEKTDKPVSASSETGDDKVLKAFELLERLTAREDISDVEVDEAFELILQALVLPGELLNIYPSYTYKTRSCPAIGVLMACSELYDSKEKQVLAGQVIIEIQSHIARYLERRMIAQEITQAEMKENIRHLIKYTLSELSRIIGKRSYRDNQTPLEPFSETRLACSLLYTEVDPKIISPAESLKMIFYYADKAGAVPTRDLEKRVRAIAEAIQGESQTQDVTEPGAQTIPPFVTAGNWKDSKIYSTEQAINLLLKSVFYYKRQNLANAEKPLLVAPPHQYLVPVVDKVNELIEKGVIGENEIIVAAQDMGMDMGGTYTGNAPKAIELANLVRPGGEPRYTQY